jgi:predicted  nucleic acid-binding Zn-ribbon protein
MNKPITDTSKGLSMTKGWATLQAMQTRHDRIRQLTSEVVGLKAQIDAKADEAESLLKEIEELSLRLEDEPTEKDS